jgi:predicted component of viral defense system (DUF524 family)
MRDTEIVKHVLKYHFLTLENQNELYEYWVFCKILDAITDAYHLKFKEMLSIEVTAFQFPDGAIRLIYQKKYHTG